MLKAKNCEIIKELECDVLYQVIYTRKCDECGYEELKEHTFNNVLKNGVTMDQDNWICPKCGKLCMTTIEVDNNPDCH